VGNVKLYISNSSGLYAVGDYSVNVTSPSSFTSFCISVVVLIYKRALRPLITDVTAMVIAVPCVPSTDQSYCALHLLFAQQQFALPVKMGPISGPEMLVNNCQHTLRNIAEERRPEVNHGGSVESCVFHLCFVQSTE